VGPATTAPTPVIAPPTTEPVGPPPTENPTKAPVDPPPTSVRIIGVDICACQPGRYIFQLDYDNGCAKEFGGEGGIEEAMCVVIDGLNTTLTGDNARPTSVNRVLISEFDQNLEVMRQIDRQGPFADGDTIEYVGFTNADENPPPRIPRGLMITMTGTNAMGVDIDNDVVVLFENNCEDFPVLQVGDSMGWVDIVSVVSVLWMNCRLTMNT